MPKLGVTTAKAEDVLEYLLDFRKLSTEEHVVTRPNVSVRAIVEWLENKAQSRLSGGHEISMSFVGMEKYPHYVAIYDTLWDLALGGLLRPVLGNEEKYDTYRLTAKGDELLRRATRVEDLRRFLPDHAR